VPVELAPAFGEVPSPSGDLAARGEWLRDALAGTWGDLGAEVARWRQALVAATLGLGGDAVVFTHFVAINALVGWAEGSALVTTFAPANASVTVVRVEPVPGAAPRLTVVRRGDEAPPQVG
jgi:broad specificity phosphatase PhoE